MNAEVSVKGAIEEFKESFEGLETGWISQFANEFYNIDTTDLSKDAIIDSMILIELRNAYK